MTSDGVNSYTWDRANRLLSMGGVDYQYDGEGRRVQQTVSSAVTKYLLDIQPGLSVVLSETTGSSVVRNVHAPKGIHARKDASSNWHWVMQDGLGSIRAEVSNSVAVEGSQNFAPYGSSIDSLGSFGTYGFTGEPTDANGLVYDRARYYVPSIGMFASLDPFEGIEDEPMSMNGYSYVHGNPVNWTDPSGEFIPFLLGVILGGAGVGGVIAGASAGRMYDLANSGACGCNMKQWAAGQNRTDFILNSALQGAITGAAFAGAAFFAPELVGVGGFLLASHNAAVGVQNFNRDPNPCTQFARDLGLASAVVAGIGVAGIGMSYGGPGPTPQLVPATGSGGVSGSAAVVGAGVTIEGGIVGGVAGSINTHFFSNRPPNPGETEGFENRHRGQPPKPQPGMPPVRGIYEYQESTTGKWYVGEAPLRSLFERLNDHLTGKTDSHPLASWNDVVWTEIKGSEYDVGIAESIRARQLAAMKDIGWENMANSARTLKSVAQIERWLLRGGDKNSSWPNWLYLSK